MIERPLKRLLIGYGNPLRRDDGVGWLLASQLTTQVDENIVQMVDGDIVRVIAAYQLTPEMAETLSQASEILFVDAVVGGSSGSWKVQTVPPNPADGISSLVHHLTPAALLALSQALYGRAPAAQILTVVGADFGYGEALSELVAAALPAVRQYALDFLTGQVAAANADNHSILMTAQVS